MSIDTTMTQSRNYNAHPKGKNNYDQSMRGLMTQSVHNREKMLQLAELKSQTGSGMMMTNFKTTRAAGSNMRGSPRNSPNAR